MPLYCLKAAELRLEHRDCCRYLTSSYSVACAAACAVRTERDATRCAHAHSEPHAHDTVIAKIIRTASEDAGCVLHCVP
eukprot:3935479-Rhodomonas_salina.1